MSELLPRVFFLSCSTTSEVFSGVKESMLVFGNNFFSHIQDLSYFSLE